VLARNAGALWRGRRCTTGQVVTFDPGQEGDHMSAADHLMVGLTVDGEFFRECAAVLGGFDPDERLAGRLAVAPGPACCRACAARTTAGVACIRGRRVVSALRLTREPVGRPTTVKCLGRVERNGFQRLDRLKHPRVGRTLQQVEGLIADRHSLAPRDEVTVLPPGFQGACRPPAQMMPNGCLGSPVLVLLWS
jgi:hypothetical protein